MPEIAEVAKFADAIRAIIARSGYSALTGIDLIGGKYMSYHIQSTDPTLIIGNENESPKWINKIKNPKTGRLINIKESDYPRGEYRPCLDNLDEINQLCASGPLQIISVNTRGKFCWIELEKDWFISMTFGMSGTIQYSLDKHSHICFHLQSDPLIKSTLASAFYFADSRRFGSVTISQDRSILDGKLAALGVDLLTDPDFSDPTIFRKYHGNICKVLMDQKGPIAGIGNYLKAEILYQCGINPWAHIEDLTDNHLQLLLTATKTIMLNAFNSQGATLYTYSAADKIKGEFQHQLKIYGKSKDPLGNTVQLINESISSDHRTTHYVPEIQKIGNHRDPVANVAILHSEPMPVPKLKIKLQTKSIN
jgi:formamidopyrimidine-DNA glycosylase